MSFDLVDALGTAHSPAKGEVRIVSLVPSITELLVDLGLGPQVVGRTRYCVHPAEAVREIPALGGTKKINLKRLGALRPTHAILNIDENTEAMAQAVSEIVPHLVVTHPLSPADNPALFRLMGGLFGRRDAAERLSAAFEAAAARLREAARDLPPRDVLYFIWRAPWMTVSRDTYVSALLRLVNWRTLCHDPAVRYPEVAIDEALLARTDIALFASEPYAFTQDDVDAFAAAHKCGQTTLALIDGAYTQWYGSRAIAGLDYLGELARRLAAS